MSDCPFFSVIVPTHKRAELLRRALQSIRSQAGPTQFEVIVVADVIDPDTDIVVSETLTSADTYVRRSGKPGPSASRNLGLSLAKGSYILFLDDDDAYHPECFANLQTTEFLRWNMPVFFNNSVVLESRPPNGPVFIAEDTVDNSTRLTLDVYVKNIVHMSCFAFPRHILTDLAFDTFMYGYEDWDFLLSVFSRVFPTHVPILGSRVFEVRDATSDRRGDDHAGAAGYRGILDYLYVYHRHPSPTMDIKIKRAQLLQMCGIPFDADLV